MRVLRPALARPAPVVSLLLALSLAPPSSAQSSAGAVGDGSAVGGVGAVAAEQPEPRPAASAAVAAEPERADRAAFERATALAAALRDELAIPGFTFAVVRGDRLVGSAAFGLADVELGVAARPEHRFRIGSVSKLVTTAVAARLVDRGLLALDAPASTFLPDLPEALRAITPRQILGHTSGIRHYAPQDESERRDLVHYDSVRASLAAFADDPLRFPPGTDSAYSTFSYTLLAALLEVAGGASFEELVAREVATPLGLPSLALDRAERIVPGRVDFYDRADDAPADFGANRPADWLDPSYKWAGGGMVASVAEVARFGAAHFTPGYLSAARLAELRVPQRTTSGTELEVGLTWRIGRDGAGRRILHHSGSQQGCRAFLLVYPDEQLSFAFLSNLGREPRAPLERALALAAPFFPATAPN